MKFEELLDLVGDQPLFSSAHLLAGDVHPAVIRRQLSRWVKSGKIIQLRRGVYAIAPPFQKVAPHPFTIANYLQPASYVSLQSALAYYNLIPEYVPVTTNVTTGRTICFDTPLGGFIYRHLKTDFFLGYRQIDLDKDNKAFIAIPEKALLDLVYLTTEGDTYAFLKELRLQNVELINMTVLEGLVGQSGKPKLARMYNRLREIIDEHREYELL